MNTSQSPTSWRAAVLREDTSELDIIEVLRPEIVAGQVLVDLDFSGVCRSQLMEVRGGRGQDEWRPHLLGHEGVGTVIEVGPHVTKVAVGDRVIVGWIRGEGLEAPPPRFVTREGEWINAGPITTFSEYSVVSENRVFHQPVGVDNRVAVLFGCALLTGGGIVLNEVQPKVGESVLINGLGGVGLAALVVLSGFDVVTIAVDPGADKRRLAKNLGAHLVLDPNERITSEQVRDVFPEGLDVAIDAAGTTGGIEVAFDCLRYNGGRLIFASHPPSGERICLDPHELIKGRTIKGSWGGDCRPDRDIPRLAQAIMATGTNLNFMVPRSYRLDEVNDALNDLEAQRAIRPILDLRRIRQ